MAEAKVVISAEDRASSVLRNVRGSVDGAVATFARLSAAAAAIGAGAAVAGITALVGQLDDLADTAQGLGLAAEELSAFQQAARASGVDAESFNGAIARLNTKLTEAQDPASTAAELFRRLGVATKNADGSVRGTGEALRDIADRFASYRDGAQKGALSAEIFGRAAGPKLVAALNEGREGLTKFGGASKESIEQASQLQGEIDKLAASWENLKLKIGGAAAALINSFIGQGTLERQLEITEQQINDTIAALDSTRSPRIRSNLEASLDEAIKKADQLRAAIKRAQGGDERAAPPPVETEAERKAREAAAEASRKRLLELDKLLADAIKIQNEDLQKQLELEARRQLLAIERFEAAEAAADEEERRRRARLDDLTGRTAENQQAEDIELIKQALDEGRISLEEYARAFDRVFGLEANKSVERTADETERFALVLTSSLGEFISSGGDGGIKSFLDSLLEDVLKLTTQLLILEPLTKSIRAAFSEGGGGLGGLLGSLAGAFGFGGARAMGGPVAAGTGYLVGEEGPELFVPRSPGTIVPNGGGGNSITVNVQGNATRETANQIAAAVSRQLAIANSRFN
jgi:hypothetical protein